MEAFEVVTVQLLIANNSLPYKASKGNFQLWVSGILKKGTKSPVR